MAIDQNKRGAARLLSQATFGYSEGDIENVLWRGYSGWIDSQLSMAPSETACNWLYRLGKASQEYMYNNTPLDAAMWRKFTQCNDQLRQRVAFSLSQIFVINVEHVTGSFPHFAAASFYDMLTQFCFGSYRDLLYAVTLHPTMGGELTYRGNQKENEYGRLPDENYAREILQLFSIGLHRLNMDGSVQRDWNGNPLETYTNADIQGLAKVFTGWDYDGYGNASTPDHNMRNMTLNPALHSMSPKSFLGVTVPAWTDGYTSMRIAIDTICNHPNVAPFMSEQLIKRMVTSNPSPSYIYRVASVWNDNGQGQRGNLSSVIKAILMDDEARYESSAATAGRIREPILRWAQWARAFGATTQTEAWNLPDTQSATERLAQGPLRSPSVFNFFRPGYTPAGTAVAAAGMVAPELQITDETSVAGYLNFMKLIIPYGWEDFKPSYEVAMYRAWDTRSLVEHVSLVMAAGQLNEDTVQTICGAVDSYSPGNDNNKRVWIAVFLTMASPQFMVLK